MSQPCENRAHSPKYDGKAWRCDECAENKQPSPLARLMASVQRTSDDEWAVFVAALRQAAGPGGLISQTRVRPLIQAIPPKHRGQLYRRAVAKGLIQPTGYEPSTDVKGGNTDKPQRTYLLSERSAA